MSPIITQLLGSAKACVIEAQGLNVQFFAKPENLEAFRDLVDEIDRLADLYEPQAVALPGSEYEPYEPSPYNGDYSED